MGLADWTPSSCAIALDAATFRVGSKSLKVTSSATTWSIVTAQSFGDLSAYTGAASGTPSTGTLGVWLYAANTTDVTSVTLRVGSSASDYSEVAGVKPYTTLAGAAAGFTLLAGWNYYVFRLVNATTTGTPVWTAADYARLAFVGTSGADVYLDYLTIGDGNVIALNGVGTRTEEIGYATVTPA